MNSPEEDAEELIFEFKKIVAGEIAALKCARICVNKMLSNTGVDRAYTHWSRVKEILDKK